MIVRALVLIACFAATGIFVNAARRAEAHPARQPLVGVPLVVDGWHGRPSRPLDTRVLAALGSDEYVDRIYERADDTPVALFIGYYHSQRQGDTMHSPLNCLPGDGWTAISRRSLNLATPAGTSAAVNRFVIEKGGTRQLVLYWYHGRGRMVAGEYAAKGYLVFDAIRRGRTDGALVRIVTPITGGGAADEQQAEARAAAFARGLVPLLESSLPS